MVDDTLSEQEKGILLRLARQAIEDAIQNRKLRPLDLDSLPARLCRDGAAFVTLTINGRLRGCIGALEAYQPLAEDVREHAVCAATSDWRFPPVRPAEVAALQIEISRLTPTQPVSYSSPADLVNRLRPGIDGVVMQHAGRRATYLPQVWDSLPSSPDFLSSLAEKMGAPADLWRREPVQISVYQVEEFSE